MPSRRYLTAQEAASALDISRATLYAYVSRGLIRSEVAADDTRKRRYYAEDIERLLARKEARRNPEHMAKEALQWGAPVMDSAITLIENGKLYYRGADAERLAQEATVEDVAARIWLDDPSAAAGLFDAMPHNLAQKHEDLLLHLEMVESELSPVQQLQVCLVAAAADDPRAYDVRPQTVAATGARLLWLMTAIAAGDQPEKLPLDALLKRGWCADDDDHAQTMLRAALILLADHELNASSFAVRVVASTGATLYAAVTAGLSALQGARHGGYTARVEALLREAQHDPQQLPDVMAGRLQRGESIPGFGHRLYPEGDPRARLLLSLLERYYGETDAFHLMTQAQQTARDLIQEEPTVDFALVAIGQVLGLPPGSALTLFALGRTMGWIGHAIEEYDQERLIRPRARYTGTQPD
jgi:citrate synthase